MSITDMRNSAALTDSRICETPRRVGRIKRWQDVMQAKFAEGTFARIARLLAPGEDRTDFVREAVEREIKRRERAKP